eukprot:1348985-Rhodomonas_salina.1
MGFGGRQGVRASSVLSTRSARGASRRAAQPTRTRRQRVRMPRVVDATPGGFRSRMDRVPLAQPTISAQKRHRWLVRLKPNRLSGVPVRNLAFAMRDTMESPVLGVSSFPVAATHAQSSALHSIDRAGQQCKTLTIRCTVQCGNLPDVVVRCLAPSEEDFQTFLTEVRGMLRQVQRLACNQVEILSLTCVSHQGTSANCQNEPTFPVISVVSSCEGLFDWACQ